MSRLGRLDRVLFFTLSLYWLVNTGLYVHSLGGPGRWMIHLPVVSAASSDDYPRVQKVYPGSPAEKLGARVGDRVVRAGEADLSGTSSRGFGATAYHERERREDRHLPLVLQRGAERFEIVLPPTPRSFLWIKLVVSLVFASCGALLLLRAPPSPTTRALFAAFMLFAVHNCRAWSATPALFYLGEALRSAATFSFLIVVVRAFIVFPEEVAPTRRWAIEWHWLLVPWGVFLLVLNVLRSDLLAVLLPMTMAAVCLTCFGLLARNYRRSSPIGRRRLKWVIYGCYVGLAPVLAFYIWQAIYPGQPWQRTVLPLATLPVILFPLGILIATIRFNLFDVDRLLSATASYNILLVLLGTAALVLVPRLAAAASEQLEINPGTGQVVLSLLLAGALIPAHRRLRPEIDRVLFKDRHALDEGIAELLTALSRCENVRALVERTGAGLNDLVRPMLCVVYARAEDSYEPVFVEGRAVPPAFDATSPLVATLVGRRTPLALADTGRKADKTALSAFDRAALETLDAEVVVPMRRENALAAFLCLGPKRSGDVYTSTDLALFSAVAEKVETQLRSFDQEETIREARAMQESLRRYVPGAIAEQLAGGAELATGEREVSVLFVDIRGYTGFSESRRAEEIFSTVNRYTEAVSEVVREHGGSVVEFNGDGMMAVFGAPQNLAHKERAAVEAGCEIVDAVGALPVEGPSGGSTKLAVGVGIATGEAFVGNIQAVDRMIWSAIGNTTNLAARLQSLTRDVDAALVIDQPTWERGQPAAADFEKRPDVPIRGRREPQDVYLLPMRARS